MSATCLTQPATPMTQPVSTDARSLVASDPMGLASPPRVRTLRHVQHPSYRTARPADRAWQLDARRPLRPRLS